MKRINWNYFGVAILLIAFVISAIRVVMMDAGSANATGEDSAEQSGKRVVRILHWQLEPGYRESMNQVIETYNQLPHVREAQVEIRQMTIPFRVYRQFVNVHLVSGTAPDIFVEPSGTASSAQMFLEPLESVLNQPNPYNAPEYLPDDWPDADKKRFSELNWKNTFVGDLAPNFNQRLKNYYTIPLSSIGSTRIFCNRQLVERARALLREGFATSPRPEWIDALILRHDESGQASGYITPNADFMEWLGSDRPIDTLGRFFVISEATWQLAKREQVTGLVPFSGSTYSIEFPQSRYLEMFTYQIGQKLDFDFSSNVNVEEFLLGWRNGTWSFDDRDMVAYFDFIRAFSQQNPAGFKGLDREQGLRRFVLGKATFMSSGGWDAASVFSQSQNFDDPADRFDVVVIDFPTPGPGERWASVTDTRVKDEDVSWATPFSINKTSNNKKWAIDFLRYITSLPNNEEFCRDAGWLPTVKKAEVVEHMEPFVPNVTGTSPKILVPWKRQLGSSIWDTYVGNLWIWGMGDIDYGTFVGRVEAAMSAERTGVDRYLYNSDLKSRDAYRSAERTRSIQQLRALQTADPAEKAGETEIYRNIVLKTIRTFSGNAYRILWMHQTENEPYPDF